MLEDSSGLVRDFVFGQLNGDGGFKNRVGESDLYYTVFGLECLLGLQEEVPESVEGYLRSFGDGDGLDLVHLACLARSWACLGRGKMPAASRDAARGRLQAFRSSDGGFHNDPHAAAGTVYGCFLALGAYQDLDAAMPDAPGVARFVSSMETADGGYSNDRQAAVGATPATAAAVALLRNLESPAPAATARWLEHRAHDQGGFVASPQSPMPDLLSTAVALHALAGLDHDFSHLKEACLDYIDTLWTNEGSFHGSWADDDLDCEYTYYGLLALGHLSL